MLTCVATFLVFDSYILWAVLSNVNNFAISCTMLEARFCVRTHWFSGTVASLLRKRARARSMFLFNVKLVNKQPRSMI